MTQITNASQLADLQSSHTVTLDELEKYKLLVESVEDYAIFLLDSEGYIQTWNKGAQKNKGWLPHEIIGKHFSQFYVEADKQAQKPERELVLARRLGRVEDEDWRVRKDGSKFWANVVITALKDTNGEVIGFAKVTRDLTQRKHNEDILRENNVQLKRQQRELELLNTSKDEFVSLASHQLRTPATAVKQLLGILVQGLMGEVDPKHLRLIQRAYDANERQIRIVESLLMVARLDAGKITLHKKPVNIHQFFHEIAEEYAPGLGTKQQELQLDYANNLPATFLVDEEYFRMALGNLIDNASNYSPENTVITIELNSTDDTFTVGIRDQGVGIPTEKQKLLFKKFSRIPNPLSERVAGSGLGLYWAKQVITMHKGDISISSVLDEGSLFTISLPVEGSHA